MPLSNLNVILFDCPRCLHNLRVAKEEAGNRIDCPQCNQALTVPTQSADAGLFDDLFDSAPVSRPAKAPAARVTPPQHDSSTSISDSDLAIDLKPDSKIHDNLGAAKRGSAEPESTGLDLAHDQADDDPIAGLAIPGPANVIDKPDDGPDAGKDPFKVDPDAPLKVDGVGDLFSSNDVFGIKCTVCDTRVHARKSQIGTEVECPICFSKVKVIAPAGQTSLSWEKRTGINRSSKPGQNKSHIVADDELKLSDPIELPKVEIDPAWGLAPVEDDLLAPKPESLEHAGGNSRSLNDVPELVVVDDAAGSIPVASSGLAKPTKRKLSSKKSPPSPDSVPGRKESTQAKIKSNTVKDFPDFELPELLSSAIEMVKSPGVLTRVAVAFALMCVGAILMQWISPAYQGIAEDSETMAAGLIKSAKWSVAYLIYLAGLAVLWWTGSFLFRDAALGKRSVSNWSISGTNEILSTFFVFAFGFFIGGLPIAFFNLLILPLRFLLGPLFLLSAWYNESPFAIVSVDAFQSTSKNVVQWVRFYMFAGGLAFLGLVAGIVFWMRAVLPFIVGVPATVLGIAICIATTLLFAVVCGWHCGRVVESLENPQ